MALLVIPYHSVWMVLHLTFTAFYIYVIILIRKNRNTPSLNSSYFQLWVNLGIADTVTATVGWSMFKFTYGMPNFPDFVADFYALLWTPEWRVTRLAIAYYVGNCETAGLTILCVNRFTSVFYPVKHEAMWLGKPMIIAPMITFGVPLAYPLLAAYGYFTGSADIETMVFAVRNLIAFVSVIMAVFCLSIITVVSVAIIVRLCVSRRKATQANQQTSVSSKKMKAAEVKLTINTIFLSSTLLGVMIVIYLPVLGVDPNLTYMWNFYIGDVYAWCNPFMLCLTSSVVRDLVLWRTQKVAVRTTSMGTAATTRTKHV